MTRIELGTGVGATNFTPTDYSYQRTARDGDIPIINYLIGSHYNENLDGLFSLTDTGNIDSSSINNTDGKLNIQLDPSDTAGATKRATHTTFMYMWPKTFINSNLETAVYQVGEITPGVAYTHVARTVFEDLQTGDKILVELQAGNSVAGTSPYLNIIEEVNTVQTILGTINLPTNELSVDWQLRFLEEGVTKFFYKTNLEEPILLWRGEISADIAECKVYHEYETNENANRTVKFDFLWILYKSIFAGFDVPIEDKMLGAVTIWDTEGTEVEDDWQPVLSKDHNFIGDRVFDNGIIRIRIKNTPEVEVYGWQTFGTPGWVKVGSYIPKSNSNVHATTLNSVVIRKFNDSIVIIDVNFGVTSQTFRISKGMSYTRVRTSSKYFDFIPYQKERFALSSDDEETNLLKWNQMHSDDDTRGNPLGSYQSATNPAVFTFDTNANTGLRHIDDVWFAFYNPTNNDVVAWIGTFLKPSSLEVEATSTTELLEARFGFLEENLIAIGILNSKPLTKVLGKPSMFYPGAEDTYVKWKSNAAIFAFDQNPFVRKRR